MLSPKKKKENLLTWLSRFKGYRISKNLFGQLARSKDRDVIAENPFSDACQFYGCSRACRSPCDLIFERLSTISSLVALSRERIAKLFPFQIFFPFRFNPYPKDLYEYNRAIEESCKIYLKKRGCERFVSK